MELHNATYENYEKLHLEMKELKFFKVIQDLQTGKWYHLPTAEYYSVGDLPISSVATLAKTAANKTGKKSSILVSEPRNIIWEDLIPV